MRVLVTGAVGFIGMHTSPIQDHLGADVVREAHSCPIASARDTQPDGRMKRYGRVSAHADRAIFALPQPPSDSPLRSEEDLSRVLVED